MAFLINEDCTSCGACMDECPTQAISEGNPVFFIDSEKCVECVGFFDEQQCATVCPVEACQPDPMHKESKEDLMNKKEKLFV